MTEEIIKQRAERYAETYVSKTDAYIGGAHTMFPEINDLKGQVASLEHLRETLVDQQAGLKAKLEIQKGLLDNAVSMLKDIYEDDDSFCERLLDIPEEEKICEIYCDKEGVQCDCILRYLKHYKKEQ